jgi:hypothetical protein
MKTKNPWYPFLPLVLILAYIVWITSVQIQPSWMIVILFALALTPISIKEFKLGKDGLSFSSYDSGELKAETQKKQQAPLGDGGTLVNQSLAEGGAPEPALSNQALKVLRTLRYYQKKTFPDNPHRIWGFTVRAGARDYTSFYVGVNELLGKGLVMMGDNDLVGLTEKGLNLVTKKDSEIDWAGDIWNEFATV